MNKPVKPKWTDYIQFEASVPEDRKKILTAILDYETTDKDNDGLIDKKSVRDLFEIIQKAFSDGKKITIKSSDEKEEETNRISYTSNINFEHHLKVGVIGGDGYVTPKSLNSGLIHEIGHDALFKKILNDKNELMVEKNRLLAPYMGMKYSVANKIKEFRKIVTPAVAEIDLKIEKLDISRYDIEKFSMDIESAVTATNGEPEKKGYQLVTYLKDPLKEVIYYTSDDQKFSDFYPDIKKQKITKEELEREENALRQKKNMAGVEHFGDNKAIKEAEKVYQQWLDEVTSLKEKLFKDSSLNNNKGDSVNSALKEIIAELELRDLPGFKDSKFDILKLGEFSPDTVSIRFQQKNKFKA